MLRKSGLTQEIIDAYVPPTSRERMSERNNIINEYEQLKIDVAILKEEMKFMKEKLGIVNDKKENEKENNENTSIKYKS